MQTLKSLHIPLSEVDYQRSLQGLIQSVWHWDTFQHYSNIC